MKLTLLKAILDVWEIDYPKLKTSPNERIKAQRLMHLLQNRLFGFDTFYGYNVFTREVWSPHLSQDYLELAENLDNYKPAQLKRSAVKKIKQVREDAQKFAEENQMSETRALEVLGLTLFFGKQYSKLSKVVTAVRTVKPSFRKADVENAYNLLKEKWLGR